jgi:hypothetical protein
MRTRIQRAARPVLSCLTGLVLFACERSTGPVPIKPTDQRNAVSVMWGLNWCPDCEKRTPFETEVVVMQEAFMWRVDRACMDAFFQGSSDWLDEQINLGAIGIDEDVYNGSGAGYPSGTPGYWVPESIRYQYWGIPIYLAAQIFTDELEVAGTMLHEALHEFDARDGIEDHDEDAIEGMTQTCLDP